MDWDVTESQRLEAEAEAEAREEEEDYAVEFDALLDEELEEQAPG
jgi:DNA-dependent RNA polymerase auxiliary subunit epsilon